LVTLRSLVTANRDLRQSHRIRLLSEVVLTALTPGARQSPRRCRCWMQATPSEVRNRL